MTTEIEKAARQALEALESWVPVTCEREITALRRALSDSVEQPAQHGCTRSHPHENMDAMCELRTDIAKLTNENARLKAAQDMPKIGCVNHDCDACKAQQSAERGEPFGHGGRPMTLRECMEAEEPSQAEPVAWATQLGEYAHIQWGAKRPEYPMVYEFPLYTLPQAREPQEPVECMCGICKLGKREPLTDEEIKDAVIKHPVFGAALMSMVRDDVQIQTFRQAVNGIARAIEAAHGIGEKK